MEEQHEKFFIPNQIIYSNKEIHQNIRWKTFIKFFVLLLTNTKLQNPKKFIDSTHQLPGNLWEDTHEHISFYLISMYLKNYT